jgi:RNA recognition motif-containing protein
MPHTIYVANLGHSVDRDELIRLFSVHGTVDSAELIDQFRTADSTRAALVEMSREEEASAAIGALDGAPLRGGPLVVGWANGEQPAAAEQPRMFGPMNVPDAKEGPRSAGPDRRECRHMPP